MLGNNLDYLKNLFYENFNINITDIVSYYIYIDSNLIFQIIYYFKNNYCRLFNLIIDLLPLYSYWTIFLLAINRLIIVLYPLKAYFIKSYFNKTNIVIFLLFVSTLYVLYYSMINDCIFQVISNNFWVTLYKTLIFIRYCVPTIGILTSVFTISVIIIKQSKNRLKYIHNNRKNKTEQKTTIIFIIYGIIYTLTTTPYSICEFIMIVFSRYDDYNCDYVFFVQIIALLQNALTYLPFIARISDGLLLFMIPEFRNIFKKLFCFTYFKCTYK